MKLLLGEPIGPTVTTSVLKMIKYSSEIKIHKDGFVIFGRRRKKMLVRWRLKRLRKKADRLGREQTERLLRISQMEKYGAMYLPVKRNREVMDELAQVRMKMEITRAKIKCLEFILDERRSTIP
jgi:hypothetical protein